MNPWRLLTANRRTSEQGGHDHQCGSVQYQCRGPQHGVLSEKPPSCGEAQERGQSVSPTPEEVLRRKGGNAYGQKAVDAVPPAESVEHLGNESERQHRYHWVGDVSKPRRRIAESRNLVQELDLQPGMDGRSLSPVLLDLYEEEWLTEPGRQVHAVGAEPPC